MANVAIPEGFEVVDSSATIPEGFQVVETPKQTAPVQQNRADGSILDPIASGLGLGFTDEALAGLSAGIALATGDIEPNQVGDMYKSVQKGIQEQKENYQADHPVLGFLGEVVPMIAGGLPAIMEKLATKGVLGAGAVAGSEAAVYGAGESDALQKGDTVIPAVPYVTDRKEFTNVSGNPYVDQLLADVGGRAMGAIEEAPKGMLFGAAGSKITREIGDIVENAATKRKLVREGQEDVRTAGLELKNPSQKTPTEVTGDAKGIDALKEFSPTKPKVVSSKAAEKALFQKIPESQIVSVREANNETRMLMKKMLEERRKGHTNKKYASSNPHYQVIGESFDKRLSAVLDERASAGARIGEAVKEFEGMKVDYSDVVDEFKIGLESNLITLNEGKLDFSQLNKLSTLNEPSVKKTLNDTLSDLANIEDAADLHRLKRDIDKRVDYVQRLDGANDTDAEMLLKQLRRSINGVLGDVSEDYRAANAVYKESTDALENLVKAMPSAKNLKFDTPEQIEQSQKILGQQLRKIQTNYANKENLNASIVEFDELSKKYGKNFNDDIEALVAFDGELKNRFGDPLTNTFQAGIEAGNKRAQSSGSIAQRTWDFFTDKSRNINDMEAFDALDQYITESIQKTK